MLSSPPKLPPTFFDSLADYPHWFVLLCATIVAVLAIWLLVKLLKWALWLALTAVLVVGGLMVVGMLAK